MTEFGHHLNLGPVSGNLYLTSAQVSNLSHCGRKLQGFRNSEYFSTPRLSMTAHLQTLHAPTDTPAMIRNFKIPQPVFTEIPTGNPLLHTAAQEGYGNPAILFEFY